MAITKYKTELGMNQLNNLKLLNLIVLQKYYIELLKESYKKDKNIEMILKINFKIRKIVENGKE